VRHLTVSQRRLRHKRRGFSRQCDGIYSYYVDGSGEHYNSTVTRSGSSTWKVGEVLGVRNQGTLFAVKIIQADNLAGSGAAPLFINFDGGNADGTSGTNGHTPWPVARLVAYHYNDIAHPKVFSASTVCKFGVVIVAEKLAQGQSILSVLQNVYNGRTDSVDVTDAGQTSPNRWRTAFTYGNTVLSASQVYSVASPSDDDSILYRKVSTDGGTTTANYRAVKFSILNDTDNDNDLTVFLSKEKSDL